MITFSNSNRFFIRNISKLNSKRKKNRKGKDIFYTNDEKTALFLKYKNEGCLKSRDELLASTYALVLQQIHIYVKKYGTFGFDIEDFEQEGNMALLDALDRYDPEKGTFPSFVRVYLPKYFFPFIKNNGSTIRLMDSAIQNIKKEMLAGDEFIKINKRYPVNGENIDFVFNGKPTNHIFGEISNLEVVSANTPITNSREQDVTEELVDSLQEIEEINIDDTTSCYIQDLLTKSWKVDGKIIKINDREREILSKIYFDGLQIKDIIYNITPRKEEIEKCKNRGENKICLYKNEQKHEFNIYCLPNEIISQSIQNINGMDFPIETKFEEIQLKFSELDEKNIYLICNGKKVLPEKKGDDVFFNLKLKRGYFVTPQSLYETKSTAFSKLRKIINHTKKEYLY